MKILYFSIIGSVTISIIVSFTFFTISDNRLHCTFCPEDHTPNQPLIIDDITTAPSELSVGSTFLIYADVNNPNPYSVYVNNGCVSPISATFNKGVTVVNSGLVSCIRITKQEIQPGQDARIVGPSIGITYNASSVGKTNATITISYVVAGSVDNITTSKFFTIDTPSPTPPASTLERQLGLASYDSISITKENTFDVNASVIHNHKKYTCPVDVPCFNPLVYYLMIYSKSQTFLLNYNICDGNSCVKEDGNTQMLGMSGAIVRLPDYGWKDDDYVNILVQLPANGSLIFDKNSTYDSVHTPKIWVDLGKSKIVSEY